MNGTIWANKLAAAKLYGGAYGNVRFSFVSDCGYQKATFALRAKN